MDIYNIYGTIIYSSDKETIKESLEEAKLSGADLSWADLSGANLSEANLSGSKLPIFCKWTVSIIDESIIKIGCKENTIEGWDSFFASNAIFSTERGTPEFIRIEANYLAAKAYLQHLNKNK